MLNRYVGGALGSTSLIALALIASSCNPGDGKDSDPSAPSKSRVTKSGEEASGNKVLTASESRADDSKTKTGSYAVPAEIRAGIESHIERKSREGKGRFTLSFEDRELNLELVRVHMEYLASLGPDSNFACVDLVDTDGEVYDVDFFMEGPPGNMKVTETTVHKTNGKPFYAWEQKEDKTWHRVPMSEASAKLQGVIEGKDAFEFIYQVTLPEMAEAGRMWLPIPTSDEYQTVKPLAVHAPGEQTRIKDSANGNEILVLDLNPEDSGAQVEMRYAVERREKGPYEEKLEDPKRYLQPSRLIPLDDELRALGSEAIRGKKTELMQARAIYDHVMDRMAYKKVGEKYGNGDATYACDSRSGNCSDYHSYFIALSRSVGIPARFAVGAAIPSSRDEGGMTGYHCWAEFYAEGKWWPIDVSEGDKYTNLSTYYFGHHPANRVELSRGRDLEVEPAPASGPINFLAHPMLEVGGNPVRIKADFSFRR